MSRQLPDELAILLRQAQPLGDHNTGRGAAKSCNTSMRPWSSTSASRAWITSCTSVRNLPAMYLGLKCEWTTRRILRWSAHRAERNQWQSSVY